MIGQTNDIHRRWGQYKTLLRRGAHDNLHLQRAWNKYGENNFCFEIIALCPTLQLDDEEIKFIQIYKATDRRCGYNIALGGHRPIVSQETKARLKVTNGGVNNGFWGKTHSAESKQRMRDAQKGEKSHMFGKSLSKDAKEKLRLYHLGRSCSEETRKKLREAKMGSKNYLFGKHRSDEVKRKIRDTKRMRRLQS